MWRLHRLAALVVGGEREKNLLVLEFGLQLLVL
jgi:hypothetical protein